MASSMNRMSMQKMLSMLALLAGLLLFHHSRSLADQPTAAPWDSTNSNAPISEESQATGGLEDLLLRAERSVVKLYGAGGIRGLESYQSGVLIGDGSLILTSWTTVLDVDKVRVVTFDGRRLDAEVVGVDPECELALLKVPNPGLPAFALQASNKVTPGQRVFAITNLFGIAAGNEACSSQKGVVMAISMLRASLAGKQTLYQGPIIITDAMTNNPGASGGALIDLRGNLIGLIGKELRDEQNGIWVNYALPTDVVKGSMERILTGQTRSASASTKTVENHHDYKTIGISMVPNVLPKTPAFIDRVQSDTPASRAGLMPNDLVLLVNEQRVDSQKGLEKILSTIERNDSFPMLVQRTNELVRIQIRP
jgi:serine protease Do